MNVQVSAALKELKPCPFCGSTGYIVEHNRTFFVGCSVCYCNLGEAYDNDAMPEHIFHEEAEAIAAWNTRA